MDDSLTSNTRTSFPPREARTNRCGPFRMWVGVGVRVRGAGLRDLPVWGLEVVAGIEGKANVGRGAARRLGEATG